MQETRMIKSRNNIPQIQKIAAGAIEIADADKVWVESVIIDGKPMFLAAFRHDGITRISILYTVQDKNGMTYNPCSPHEYPYPPYEFSREEISDFRKYELEVLIDSIKEQVDAFMDMPEDQKTLLATTIMYSYHQDKGQTTPYLAVIGGPGSGKTRLQELVTWLAYRTMHGSSIPPADIFTYLGKHGEGLGTICIDECQTIIKDNDLMRILKAGYRKGSTVPRIDLNNGRKQEFFNTYGLKVLAGESLPNDEALIERCIQIDLVEGTPARDEITDGDIQTFKELRNKLLLYRMQTKFEALADIETDLKGRTKELWKPLIQTTHGTKYEATLKGLASLEQSKRIETRRNSLEGQIAQIVCGLYNSSKGKPIPFDRIWQELITLGSEECNDTAYTDAYGKVTKQKVGRILQNVLHGQPSVDYIDGEKKRVYYFERTMLEKVAKRYSLNLETMEMIETI